MNLFGKLFCSMVLITVIACSLGGYLLIDSQFRTSIEREVASTYEENEMLRYALSRELEISSTFSQQELADLCKGINISVSGENVAFRVSSNTGETVMSSGVLLMNASELTSHISEGQRGWSLWTSADQRTYIHAASPLLFGGDTLWLENCREITDIFMARQEQYHTFLLLQLGIIVLVGFLSFAVSSVITRPLTLLSRATKRFAAGELEQRVRVVGDDELGKLSRDFNVMAARIEEQMQELTEAAQRQEDFMGSFAHEIKTPLTSIIGYADLLRSRELEPEQVRKSAGFIFSEGRRLEALSHKLMELIVLEKQDFPLRMVEMRNYLQKIGDALIPVFEQKGIRLRVRAETSRIPLEPDLMETVCLNLLDNARKSFDGNGVVILEGLQSGGGYCIRVTDNGKGIPAKELGRITEAFYMVDKSRSRAQGGAGLGLAVCQRIVALHGGRMEFSSVENKGTRVTVWLRGGENI